MVFMSYAARFLSPQSVFFFNQFIVWRLLSLLLIFYNITKKDNRKLYENYLTFLMGLNLSWSIFQNRCILNWIGLNFDLLDINFLFREIKTILDIRLVLKSRVPFEPRLYLKSWSLFSHFCWSKEFYSKLGFYI